MNLTTNSQHYTERLTHLESVWWKRLLPVQAPYRFHLRSLRLGFTLDIGCGLGRNLLHLGGTGVGVDHNEHSIEVARLAGLKAYIPAEFIQSEWARGTSFDSLLLSHILEHLEPDEATRLVRQYLSFLKVGGRVVMICPQPLGYRSDPTHVTFFDLERLKAFARNLGLRVANSYSFPFPTWVGHFFKHNEFVLIAVKR